MGSSWRAGEIISMSAGEPGTVAIARNRREFWKSTICQLFAIGAHLIGQLVCDPNNDVRSDALVPADCRGKAGKKRAWAVETMKAAAKAAKKLGIEVVTGFTGSSIWHLVYDFPPTPPAMIDRVTNTSPRCGTRSSTSLISAAFASRWNLTRPKSRTTLRRLTGSRSSQPSGRVRL